MADNLTEIERRLTDVSERMKLYFSDGKRTLTPIEAMDRYIVLPALAALASPKLESLGYREARQLYELQNAPGQGYIEQELKLLTSDTDVHGITVIIDAFTVELTELFGRFKKFQTPGTNVENGDACVIDLEALFQYLDNLISVQPALAS